MACLAPHLDDFGELTQKPRIDFGRLVHLLDRPAAVERAEHIPHAPIVRHGETLAAAAASVSPSVPAMPSVLSPRLREQQAAASELERPHALHERFLERPANRHRLADRLHLRRQRPIGLRELLEVPSRDLDDDVVDGRLEAGGREARDVVRNFVEVITERELRGDLRDRKARGLRRERRRARHARVHLDDDHPAVRRVDRELNVRPAGLDADLADDLARGVAHPLIFLVGQRQDRRDGDAVARVHAHRIDVFDRADDDEVVGDVAHHLELEFLPADDGLFDEHSRAPG